MIATLPEKLKKRLAAVDTRVHVVSVKCPCNERQIREQRSHIHPKGDCPVRPSGLLKGHKGDSGVENACFGPELKLGLSLAEGNPNERIIISKSYISGSRISWELNDDGTLNSAGSCARGLSALRKLTDQPPEAVFWIQGEGDTVGNDDHLEDGDGAAHYKGRLGMLIRALRREIAPQDPTSLLVGLVDSLYGGSAECDGNVNQWQAGIQIHEAKRRVSEEIENVAFVANSFNTSSPDYLPTWCNETTPDEGPGPRARMTDGHVDSLSFHDCPCFPGHLTTTGLTRLGWRLADTVYAARRRDVTGAGAGS
jgi:hypothetical protein